MTVGIIGDKDCTDYKFFKVKFIENFNIVKIKTIYHIGIADTGVNNFGKRLAEENDILFDKVLNYKELAEVCDAVYLYYDGIWGTYKDISMCTKEMSLLNKLMIGYDYIKNEEKVFNEIS